MGLGETLVAGIAGDLLHRRRAPHLAATDAAACSAPGDLGPRT